MTTDDRMRSDLQWCYDRLSHILHCCEQPYSVEAGFGIQETLRMLKDDLPGILERHKLSDCYHET